ncbi:MAG: hypothetical protein ACO27H_11720 [Burkholderiaceae bacterium]|jgi:hypothetical protein
MLLAHPALVRRAVATALLALGTLVLPLHAADAPAPAPAPRDASGRVLIANAPGEPIGLWVTDYSTRLPFFMVEQIRFKPWAKGLYDARQAHDLEPHARCKASGAIRQFLTPYGVEIVEFPELQQIYIFDLGGPHSWRTIYLDGRGHPADLDPSNYGHSIGHWEGDTLVVETVGYNTAFWFERAGLPHTESAKTTEYFTRRDARTLDYRFVLDDPLTYDAPVEGRLKMNWRQEELFEYVCQQSNYAPELMVGDNIDAIGRSSIVVP